MWKCLNTIPFVFTACVALTLNPPSAICICGVMMGSKYRKQNEKILPWSACVEKNGKWVWPSLLQARRVQCKQSGKTEGVYGIIRKSQYCMSRVCKGSWIKIQSVSTGWRCSEREVAAHGWQCDKTRGRNCHPSVTLMEPLSSRRCRWEKPHRRGNTNECKL